MQLKRRGNVRRLKGKFRRRRMINSRDNWPLRDLLSQLDDPRRAGPLEQQQHHQRRSH